MHRKRLSMEKTVEALHRATNRALAAENFASQTGLLQRIDARVKAAGLVSLILATVLAARFQAIAAVFVLALALAALSAIPLSILTPLWAGVLTFTGTIAIPAIFLTPGVSIYRIPGINWEITRQGLTSATYLITRAETVSTLAALIIFTTPWTRILRALRVFRVPVVFVVVLGMTCRYILLMLETAHDMFQSRRSRTIGNLTAKDRRHIAVSSAGVLLGKSLQLSGEVHLAMQARGFRGEAHVLDEFQMTGRDWLALTGFVCSTAVAIWMGR